MEKEYLGDSVYVEIENGMLKLTTENGIGATNTIFMEVEVYDALIRFHERAVAYYASKRKEIERGTENDL